MRKLIILTLFTLKLQADVEFIDFAVPELITSSRGLGMGNANFGADHGPYTAFTNPASIAPIKKYRFGLVNVSGEFSSDTFSNTFGKKGVSFASIQTGVDFLSNRNMRAALVEDGSGYLYQRLGVLSFFQFKNITIGHFSSHQSNGALESKTSNFYGNRREDYGPYISYSSRISRNFSFGATYSYLTRSESYAQIDSDGDDLVNETMQGNFNHLITAIKYRYDRQFFISLVNRNSAGSTFFARENGSPTKIPNSTDLGFTGFIKRRRIQINLVARDLTNAYDEFSTSRKLQFGVHYSFRRSPSSLKFGYMDGHMSAGFNYETKNYGAYGLSTYAVDSSVTGVMDVDRRFVLEFRI